MIELEQILLHDDDKAENKDEVCDFGTNNSYIVTEELHVYLSVEIIRLLLFSFHLIYSIKSLLHSKYKKC